MNPTTNDPTTIVAQFLLTRIAEDEKQANRKRGAFDRRRILDECYAKRRLIASAMALDAERHHHPITFADGGLSHAMFGVLTDLTYPYRDDPACPIEWQEEPDDIPRNSA